MWVVGSFCFCLLKLFEINAANLPTAAFSALTKYQSCFTSFFNKRCHSDAITTNKKNKSQFFYDSL